MSQPKRSHLLALLLKNAQLKLASPVTALSEILVPMTFMLLLSIGYWLASSPQNDSELYGSDMANTSLYIKKSFCYNASSPTVSTALQQIIAPCFLPLIQGCLPAPLSDVCFESRVEVTLVLGVVAGALPVPFTVMDIDAYLMMQHFTKTRRQYGESLFEHSPAGAFMHCGQLGLVGTPETTEPFLRYVANRSAILPMVVRQSLFASLSEAESYAYSHGGTLWAVLDTTHLSENSFTIRMNYTATPFTITAVNKFAQGLSGSQFSMYSASGFLSLQSLVSDFLMRDREAPIPALRPFPTPGYLVSTFVLRAGQFFPLVMTFALLYPLSRLLSAVVVEKETRVRQVMLVMGLPSSTFYLSWIITALVSQFVSTLLSTMVLCSTFYSHVEFTFLFALNFLFAMSIVSMGLLISVFFSKSRIAAVVGPLLLFISTVPHFAIPAGTNTTARIAASVLPCTAYASSIDLLTSYVANGHVGWGSLFEDDFSFGTCMMMMIFDIFLYLSLGWYLDHVLPSDYGSRRPPLFLFSKEFWCPPESKDLTPMVLPTEYPSTVEPIVGDDATPAVHINNLSKTFPGDVRAVQGLDITFEVGKVQVLLGHNGAGKTTVMNILIGMLPPSSGDAIVYGRSVLTQIDHIRQSIGFCPQHNVLWPTLSVAEHLRFFAALKNVPRNVVERVCVEMAARVNLSEKYDAPSSVLSGGQKRKLSVAIAFLGDNKFILLDEPTAGMDVHARRATWDLVQAMRPGRCILLSTHFMDEAELLGDRIAIMKRGRLHSCGTSLYLKSLLGVGHNLSISLHEERGREGLSIEILKLEPTAIVLTSVALELSFRLPMGGGHLASLFEFIEGSQGDLGIQSFGLSVTTMEEVFLRIAEDVEEHAELEIYGGDESSPLLIPSDFREPSFSVHLSAMFMKRAHCAKRDRRALCFQVVMPGVFLAVALLLLLLGPPRQPSLTLDSTSLYGRPSEVLFTSRNGSVGGDFPQGRYVSSWVEWDSGSSALADTLLESVMSHPQDRYIAMAFEDTLMDALNQTWNGTTIMHNASAQHASAEGLAAYYSAKLRSATGDPRSVITVTNHPLPMGEFEQQFVDNIKKIISAILIMIPFTFIPANFVGFIVKENECLAKHLQWVSGANVAAYWTGSLLWDLLSFLGTEALAFLVFFAFQRDELVGTLEVFAASLSVFVMFAVSSTPLSYLLSFCFTSHASAQTVVLLGNFITGFLLVMAAQILVLFDSTRDAILLLMKIFRLVPSYALGEALITLTQRRMVQMFQGYAPSPFAYVEYDASGYGGFVGGVGTALVYMAAVSPVFFGALFVIERVRFVRWRAMLATATEGEKVEAIEDEDPAVAAERRAVELGEGRETDAVTVQRLCKTYPTRPTPKVAVRDVSFGVHRGEIFAFLGPNGAGKTTTLRILTGEQGQTSGRCFVDGLNVTTNIHEARKKIGFCPQFDGLLEHMTPREHLVFYGTLRGLQPRALESEVCAVLRRLDLTRFENTASGSLSGGNKRKLSVAIALVGGPPVVVLDEPSAGMDPMARRGLWKSLLLAAKDRSIILTTHHLEEVEALASRVAIIIDGRLKCLGTLQDLKTKYGEGAYELQIRAGSEDGIRMVLDGIGKVLPTAVHVETNGARVAFRITGTPLSEIFRTVEGHKGLMDVREYSVNQTTLEQVFLRVCGDAVVEDT